MKKLWLVLVTVLMLGVSGVSAEEDLPPITEHEKVTLNFFRGNGCGGCYNMIEHLAGIIDDYSDYFEVVTYEVWGNSYNNDLMDIMIDELGIPESEKIGIPFIIIGDQYFVGYSESNVDKIIAAALEAYQDEDYENLVAKTIDEQELRASSMTFADAAEEEGITYEVGNPDNGKSESGMSDGLVIGIIFVVVIGGFAALMYASKK